MPNQYKPIPPIDEIQEYITYFYRCRLNDKEIAKEMKDHYDQDKYGLSVASVKRVRKSLGLLSTRQQKHSLDSINRQIEEIRARFPTRGIENIRKSLHTDYGMFVPRPLIAKFLKQTEPEAVEQRKARRLVRKCYWAAGVNDTWSQDQHDKWGRFGLWLHACVDVFSGYIIWIKIWWNNRNPRVVCSWYIDAVRKLGAIPLVTQSDPGTENYGVANAQTVMRHSMDPSLADTMQHRWMHKKQNIKAEIVWSLLRHDWTPGFENTLDKGVNQGWYKATDPLESLLFRWLAIPWLQAELDSWIVMRNFNAPRADKNKVLPHGVPEMVYSKPESFGALDFKIPVSPDLVDRAEQDHAPPGHEVHELVPPIFAARAHELYTKLGNPPVTSASFWDVYKTMLWEFCNTPTPLSHPIASVLTAFDASKHVAPPDPENPLPENIVPLLPGLKELRAGDDMVGELPEGFLYIGGLSKPIIPPSIAEAAAKLTTAQKGKTKGSKQGSNS
ncbi:hypothetical protein PC9H_010123 [Pleurotus ostreatus]|uniref:Integrase core domain-containing protein n=1 Tax=Pleurotus ostreatus TaxID=5322 RepID=A0A8H7DQ90_PLEOS|nr:uncharacterized protein PC9H_010123 [Pleurotus ostreatus]KAF7424812.1 hypothetical protein PC9H_010123 [Pleurotus ostreatus]